MSNVSGFMPPPAEVVNSPSPDDWDAFYVGAGDDVGPPVVRGGGQRLKLTFAGAGTAYVDLQFAEPVELLDGQVIWDEASFDHDDLMNFYVRFPATVAVVNEGDTGNCNLIDAGGYNVIVPADGDGTHDVDLDAASPVPATKGAADGYWEVDHGDGIVTVSTNPGLSRWHLLDVEVTGHFIKNISMGHPLGVFDIDNYRVFWVHPNWRARFEIVKASSSAGVASAWLLMFRKNVS